MLGCSSSFLFYISETLHTDILFGLGLAFPVLFLAWARFSGRWKDMYVTVLRLTNLERTERTVNDL